MTVVAAGIVLLSVNGRVLLLQRSGVGDHADEWALPGGKVEGDESLEDAAIRECNEEIGFKPNKLTVLTRQFMEDVDYTTFIATVPKEFKPSLDDEHTDFVWVRPEEAAKQVSPGKLHPGLDIVLQRLGMDELDVAEAIADGKLPSPQQYENIWLFALRITGIGQSYRKSKKEHVWRDSSIYLNDRFLKRCNGLPVILDHPKGKLDTEEFKNRVIGTIFVPYIKGESVWGIAKILDEDAADMMRKHQLSTSPSVSFRDVSVNERAQLEDGSTLLIEGDPSLLDHVAVCELGVWDKGGTPSGVDLSGEVNMADETKEEDRKREEEAARQDAENARNVRLDKLMDRFDSFGDRLDKLEATRKDAEGEREEEDPPKEDPEDPDETAADTKRKDAEEAEAKKKEEEERRREDARKAADSRRRVDADEDEKKRLEDAEVTKRRMDAFEERLPREQSDAEREELAEAQDRADSVFAALGEKTPYPAARERPSDFRRRVLNRLKKHSAKYSKVDLATVTDPSLFSVVEDSIYSDAMASAHNPINLPPDMLREVRDRDSTGRVITKFIGTPDACWGPFKGQKRNLTGINKE